MSLSGTTDGWKRINFISSLRWDAVHLCGPSNDLFHRNPVIKTYWWTAGASPASVMLITASTLWNFFLPQNRSKFVSKVKKPDKSHILSGYHSRNTEPNHHKHTFGLWSMKGIEPHNHMGFAQLSLLYIEHHGILLQFQCFNLVWPIKKKKKKIQFNS